MLAPGGTVVTRMAYVYMLERDRQIPSCPGQLHGAHLGLVGTEVLLAFLQAGCNGPVHPLTTKGMIKII